VTSTRLRAGLSTLFLIFAPGCVDSPRAPSGSGFESESVSESLAPKPASRPPFPVSGSAPGTSISPTELDKHASGVRTQRVTLTQGDVKRSVVITTEPIVDGCSVQGAMKTLSTRHSLAHVCATEYAKRHGSPPKGRVVLALSLKKSGEVAQAAVVADPIGEAAFMECLKEAIRVKFPNPFQKNCIVQAPFQFTGSTKPSVP
jgi:hypothetical protein